MKKLNLSEIHEVIEFEDRCGVQNLIQDIFSSEFVESGIDVIDTGKEYWVIKGTTLKVKTSKI